jgi:thymidylate synthase (FAD)
MPLKVALLAKTALTKAAYIDMKSWRPDQGQGSDAEKLVEIAGRTCYDSGGSGRNSKDFHKHILEVGHGSVLEHATWTFKVSGVSRNFTHELVRHRVGTAFSQRSTRYCDESGSPVVDHPLVSNMSDVPEGWAVQVTDLKAAAQRVYDEGVEFFQAQLVGRGCDRLSARKQARAAMARYLPSGLETEIVITVNARAARGIIEQRASSAADAEIRNFAMQVWEILVLDSPQLFGDYDTKTAPDGLGSSLVTSHRKV